MPGKYELRNCIKRYSHIGHCTHTAGSADVKVQNIFNMRNNITCSTELWKYNEAMYQFINLKKVHDSVRK